MKVVTEGIERGGREGEERGVEEGRRRREREREREGGNKVRRGNYLVLRVEGKFLPSGRCVCNHVVSLV